MRRSGTTVLWTMLLAAFVTAPFAIYLWWGRGDDDSLTRLSVGAGLVGFALLLAAFVLPSRLRVLTSHLGIQTVLRSHRTIAPTAAGVIALHVVVALAHSDRGLGMLDLRDAPGRVWTAVLATVALALLLFLASDRRRRRRRYEGWRLVHLVLAWVVVAGGTAHVILLDRLVERPVIRWCLAAGPLIVIAVVGYRWLWRPMWSLRRSYVVDEVREESATAVTVVLHARGHKGVPFKAGQFAWLKVGSSPFVFEEHPFTISSSATEPWRKEFTIKALGDFSEIVGGLRPGRRVYLDGPHGRFTIDGLRTRGFVFIAGGIGVTPMLSMLRTLAQRRDTRRHLLVVGGRTAEELLHRAEIDELRGRLDLTVVEVLNDPSDDWVGENGQVGRELLDRYLPSGRGNHARRNMDYFVCGPPGMVGAVVAALTDLDIRASRVHTELFDMA